MKPRQKVIQAYHQRFGSDPVFIGRAPGRVNLMGEHVDYNAGFVLPAAINRSVAIAFSPSGDETSTILAADFSSETILAPDRLASRHDRDGRELPDWALYPAGILSVLQAAGLPAPGMRATFAADIPRGAGLSSSAAVELAFMKAWQTLGGWQVQVPDLAVMAQRAESEYVGVRCGIMDQYASAYGRKGQAIYLDCRDLNARYIDLPAGIGIVIADSAVRHSLAGGAGQYNERRAVCEDAATQLRQWLPGIRSLRDVTVDQIADYASRLPESIRQAAQHVVGEIERTRQAVERLESGDVKAFGRLMLESHTSLRDLYHVSSPELDTLVRIAMDLPGCLGARLTGAGFGGCTVNLVDRQHAQQFIQSLTDQYKMETGLRPHIWSCQASQGAEVNIF